MLGKRAIILRRQKRRRRIKWLKRSVFLLFLGMNLVAYLHAYRFTHFRKNNTERTHSPVQLSFLGKLSTVIFGVSNPRPANQTLPKRFYETILIPSNKTIECWSIRQLNPKGTVILFHGYGSEKSALIAQSDVFMSMGYNTLLVDFMGCGGSDGEQTTIGFLEAEEVKSCYDYLRKKHEKNIYLYGTSMGAVAIMKAMSDAKMNPNYKMEPSGIILECPFGSMRQTVKARFKNMNIPSFPMSDLLVFWGGIQNGFWAFDHRPVDYAKRIDCPTLLMYGELDDKVSRSEIDDIYAGFGGEKQLVTFPDAGHERYLKKDAKAWRKAVLGFLKR